LKGLPLFFSVSLQVLPTHAPCAELDVFVVGGWWLVVGGWWLVVGGWWLVVGGWWLVVGVDDLNLCASFCPTRYYLKRYRVCIKIGGF
jgi:hypothetical protein